MENSIAKIYTVNETAQILKVHFNTVYELIRQKKIKAVKIGKTYRITDEFINEFIQDSSKN